MFRFVIAQRAARVFLGIDKHRGATRRMVGSVEYTIATDAESMLAIAQKKD